MLHQSDCVNYAIYFQSYTIIANRKGMTFGGCYYTTISTYPWE